MRICMIDGTFTLVVSPEHHRPSCEKHRVLATSPRNQAAKVDTTRYFSQNMSTEQAQWEQTEKLLSSLETRIYDLEKKKKKAEPVAVDARTCDAELALENAKLKEQVKKLEYRVSILVRSLKEVDGM